ncbi:MAG: hypothetical protein ACRD2L_19275, partial [Terriglobia bacterium]
ACKRSLIDPEEPHNTNYGLLRTHFGYGSRLEDLSDLYGPNDKHLCEDCWEKALAAVGLTARPIKKATEPHE